MIQHTRDVSELAELKADYVTAFANAKSKALQYNLFRYQLVRSWFTKFFKLSDAIRVYNSLVSSTDERMRFDRNKKGFMLVHVRYNNSNLVEFEASLLQASETNEKSVYDFTREYPLDLQKLDTYLEWCNALTMLIPIDVLGEDMSKLVRPSNDGYWIKLEQAIDISQLYQNGGMGRWLGVHDGIGHNLHCKLSRSVI